MAAGTVITRAQQWWRDLETAPVPLSPAQRIALVAGILAAVLSRFAAIAKTPWDWDEAQFISALRAFDVTLHHPHPPGFPLFIGAAKLLVLAGAPPFRALQAIDVLAAMAIFAAMFVLAREVRASFDVAFTAAAFLAFFPNVWFYGGTAFSDVPAMVLIVVAMALLFRGCRSDAAFIAGAVVLAISAGVRPQNLMIGALPFAIGAIRRRRVVSIATASVLVIAIVAVSYAAAVHLSGGWNDFRDTLAVHQRYITQVDSFRSPDRPALWRVFDDFFIRPYRAPLINAIVTILVLAGSVLALTARRAGSLAVLAAFAPFCLFAWLILDRFSVSRFSIGYAPLMALLAAEGVFAIARRPIAAGTATVLTILMIVWTWPALRIVRTTASPPMAAVDAIRQRFAPAQSQIDVERLMTAFGDAMLPEYSRTPVDAIPLIAFGERRTEVFLREGTSVVPGTLAFHRAPLPLWMLARQRYFDVSVVPVRAPAFGDGWYAEETDGSHIWRWMGRRGVIALPPSICPAHLHLRLTAARGAAAAPPIVTIAIDGRVIDRIAATSPVIDRTFDIALHHDRESELTITTDGVVVPSSAGASNDARELGVRLDGLELQLEFEPERHPDLHALPVLHRR